MVAHGSEEATVFATVPDDNEGVIPVAERLGAVFDVRPLASRAGGRSLFQKWYPNLRHWLRTATALCSESDAITIGTQSHRYLAFLVAQYVGVDQNQRTTIAAPLRSVEEKTKGNNVVALRTYSVNRGANRRLSSW